MIYPNLFKTRYPKLTGKNWLQNVSAEDKKAFVEIGLKHSDYGRLGGIKRAQTAKRDSRGRFVANK